MPSVYPQWTNQEDLSTRGSLVSRLSSPHALVYLQVAGKKEELLSEKWN